MNDPRIHLVLYIADAQERAKVVYTLATRHGQLLLVFASEHGELARFADYAATSLKPGYAIRKAVVVAANVKEVGEALKRDGLLPSTPTGLVLEGTPFFDQVIHELEEDTIWPEP